MRNSFAYLIACASLCACAQAEPPRAATLAGRVMPAIVDAEPEVTQQVSTLLGKVGQGTFELDQLTDNARAAMTAARLEAMRNALRPCGMAPALELLRRTTKGEDRQYVYRVPCGGKAQLVDIDFNKGGKINRLVVRQQ